MYRQTLGRSSRSDLLLHQLANAQVLVRHYSEEAAQLIDVGVDRAADVVRETLAKVEWIPEPIRPKAPYTPPAPVVTLTRFESFQDWLSRHKILTGFIVVTFGTVAYQGYVASCSMKKTRRARRARNGGRTEVVVIAGSPTLPLTKSLSLDMERRGFIVYIVCNAAEDESMVQTLSRPDIRPLSIDTTDVSSVPITHGLPANREPSLQTPVLPSSDLPSTSSSPKPLVPR